MKLCLGDTVRLKMENISPIRHSYSWIFNYKKQIGKIIGIDGSSALVQWPNGKAYLYNAERDLQIAILEKITLPSLKDLL